MEIIKLTAKSRPERGKSASTRLRSEGLIPAVAYGKTLAATTVAVAPKGIKQVLKSAHGKNTVVSLEVDGGSTLTVMVRDVAVDPLSRELLHADFYEVKLDQPVDVEVPFRCTGKAKGVAAGGVLQIVYRRLPVRCLPEEIPAVIEADVTDVELGESFKVSSLTLPNGVKIRLPSEQTVAVVAAPEKETVDTAAAAAVPGAAPAAAAAPAKGAPAAAGAKPAAAAAKPAAKDKKK